MVKVSSFVHCTFFLCGNLAKLFMGVDIYMVLFYVLIGGGYYYKVISFHCAQSFICFSYFFRFVMNCQFC